MSRRMYRGGVTLHGVNAAVQIEDAEEMEGYVKITLFVSPATPGLHEERYTTLQKNEPSAAERLLRSHEEK